MFKKILIFLLAIVASKTLCAQEISFEETVAYLKKNTVGRAMYPGGLDAYTRAKGYIVKDLVIEKDGRITIETEHRMDINDFKIIFNVFDLQTKTDYPEGIRSYKYVVHFGGLNVSEGYGIAYATDPDAERVARAFRHLKKVCEKKGDLFDAPAEEVKKPQLSREETIDYINNTLKDTRYTIAEKCSTYVKVGKNLQNICDHKVFHYYWYSSQALKYDARNKTYSLQYRIFGESPCSRLPSSQAYQFNEHEIGIGHFWGDDNLKMVGKMQFFDQDESVILERCKRLETLPYYSADFYYLKVKTSDSEFLVYIKKGDNKTKERLKKAFLRLNELDAEGPDPFD